LAENLRLSPAERLQKAIALQRALFAAMSPEGQARFHARNLKKRRIGSHGQS
jgi:hypothetical protein